MSKQDDDKDAQYVAARDAATEAMIVENEACPITDIYECVRGVFAAGSNWARAYTLAEIDAREIALVTKYDSSGESNYVSIFDYAQLQARLEAAEKEIESKERMRFACALLNMNLGDKLTAALAREAKLIEALECIRDNWDVSNPSRVVPALHEREMRRNDSMAATSILAAVDALAENVKARGDAE